MNSDKNGLAAYQKAEKKLNSWSFFGGKESKYEEAAELFEKAGNSYKITKEWNLAGDAFRRAADCLTMTKSFETMRCLLSAANCYKYQKTDLEKAVECYQGAHDLSLNEGKFAQAAKYLKEIAEIHESDLQFDEAIDFYGRAAEIFETENDNSQNIACLLKMAQFLSTKEIGKYSDAITIYEKLANKSIDNNLLKFRVKEHLFKAGLCWLALEDLVGATRAIDDYDNRDCSFSSSREGKFLREILGCLNAYDVDGFRNAVVEFDSISPLDAWKTEILLVIKRTIPSTDRTEELNDQNDNDEEDGLR